MRSCLQFLKDPEEITRVAVMRGDILQVGKIGLCFVTTLPLPSKMDVLVVFPDFLELSC